VNNSLFCSNVFSTCSESHKGQNIARPPGFVTAACHAPHPTHAKRHLPDCREAYHLRHRPIRLPGRVLACIACRSYLRVGLLDNTCPRYILSEVKIFGVFGRIRANSNQKLLSAWKFRPKPKKITSDKDMDMCCILARAAPGNSYGCYGSQSRGVLGTLIYPQVRYALFSQTVA
jgi:hypothetical protein